MVRCLPNQWAVWFQGRATSMRAECISTTNSQNNNNNNTRDDYFDKIKQCKEILKWREIRTSEKVATANTLKSEGTTSLARKMSLFS